MLKYLRPFVFLFAAGFLPAGGACLRAAIVFSQASPGNVFLTNETVRIPLTCSGDRLEWSATDFSGTVVRQSSVVPSDGAAVILPALSRRGYFELRVVEKRGAAVLSEKTTAFAVLTPVDVTGMAASPFGVQTHSAQGGDPALYGLLAKAGIAHFRDEHYWEVIETSPLGYRYPAAFEKFMAAAAASKLQPFLSLDWANPLYDYDAGMFTAPHSDRGRQGFAAYAADLVRHYPALKQVEVWNEYNAGTFIAGPAVASKPASYKAMLERTAQAVRAARPDVKIVAGGTVPVAHGFLRDVFAQGAMPSLDVVSVHPYRVTPEGVDAEIAELRELIKRYNNGAEKPIWASEFSREVAGPAQQKEAATYLAQIVTLMLSQRVERMYYYLAQDDSAFPHRGLLAAAGDAKGALTPHPAYAAYATVIRQLGGYAYHSRFTGTASSTYAFRFQRGLTRMNVLWAAEPVAAMLRTDASVFVTDIMGQMSVLAPVDGYVTLNLSRNPQYVQGPVEAVVERDNPILADSVSGYGAVQGVHGWSYGSATIASGAAYDPARFTPMRWDYPGSDAACWMLGVWHFISVEQMHPGASWAVRRWTSPVAATVTVSGRVARGAGGDGVNVAVHLDGRTIYRRRLLPGESAEYKVSDIPLTAGARMDFTVDQAGESSFDSTTFTARVARQ